MRVRHWPMGLFFGLFLLMGLSALYSPSNLVLSPDAPSGLLDRAVIISLFWIAASHIQQKEDLGIFAGAVVFVSLVLSTWVIWTAWRGNFTAFRGGVGVNENYVSIFILVGAITVVHFLLLSMRW